MLAEETRKHAKRREPELKATEESQTEPFYVAPLASDLPAISVDKIGLFGPWVAFIAGEGYPADQPKMALVRITSHLVGEIWWGRLLITERVAVLLVKAVSRDLNVPMPNPKQFAELAVSIGVETRALAGREVPTSAHLRQNDRWKEVASRVYQCRACASTSSSAPTSGWRRSGWRSVIT